MSGPTIEATHSRVMSVSQCVRKSNGKTLQGWQGDLRWTSLYSRHVDVLHFATVVNRGEERGFIDITHVEGLHGRTAPEISYRVWLRATHQPFGGLRWWFVCPRSGRMVHKLYLPNGAARFASRQAYRLDYSSQRISRAERARQQAWKKRLAMGGEVGDPLGSPLEKPLWRHWRTWDRDVNELERLEARSDTLIAASLSYWLKHAQAAKSGR